MQWRKYRLSAGAIAVLMAFRLAAQSFTPALIQGRTLDAAAAAQIEASLKADPHNLEARARLLGYYSARGAQDPDARGARLQAIQWLIENEPSALLLRYPVVRLQASDFAAPHAAFLETLRRAWREQVARRPDDPVVIENAVRSVGWVESTINSGEKLVPFLERLRVLEPGDPEWAIGLADVYSAALSRGVAQNASGAAKQFAIDVRAELEKSGDAALVGLSGGMLEGGSPLFRNLPADSPLRTFGETLLRRAARLNPQNPGWTQFLSASAPHNMASLGGTLQESDLWPGGHEMAVPPGAIRMPAETEKARRPALTLIVPPPAAGAPCNLQFDALIGRDGRIEKLQLIAFDHLAYSNLVFLSSALDALREARYPPALAGGQAVEAVTRIELTSPTNIPPPVSGVVGGVPGGLAERH